MNVPKLRFKEFNDYWIETKIQNVASVVGGGTPSTDEPKYWGNEINWFTPSETGKTKYVAISNRKISQDGLKNSSAKLLPKGTILLSSRATVGEASILLNEASTNQGFQSLIVNENNCNEFIYYLKYKYKREMLIKSFGSTFLEISKSNVENIKIKIPSIEEQFKIANFLSLLDKKIELQSKKIEDLKLFKKGLDQSIFNNKTLFKQELFKNLFDSDGGTALEKYISKDGTHKIISIGNYSTNGLYIDNGQRITLNDKTKTKLLDKDNLVMILNDKTTSGDIIGSTILIDKDNHYIYNQRSQKLICKNIDPKYAWSFLNSNTFRKRIFQLSQGGTQIYVNFPTIEKETINIPKDENISNLIINSIFSIYKKIELENNKLDKLQQLKKGLMQSVFV